MPACQARARREQVSLPGRGLGTWPRRAMPEQEGVIETEVTENRETGALLGSQGASCGLWALKVDPFLVLKKATKARKRRVHAQRPQHRPERRLIGGDH